MTLYIFDKYFAKTETKISKGIWSSLNAYLKSTGKQLWQEATCKCFHSAVEMCVIP